MSWGARTRPRARRRSATGREAAKRACWRIRSWGSRSTACARARLDRRLGRRRWIPRPAAGRGAASGARSAWSRAGRRKVASFLRRAQSASAAIEGTRSSCVCEGRRSGGTALGAKRWRSWLARLAAQAGRARVRRRRCWRWAGRSWTGAGRRNGTQGASGRGLRPKKLRPFGCWRSAGVEPFRGGRPTGTCTCFEKAARDAAALPRGRRGPSRRAKRPLAGVSAVFVSLDGERGGPAL